MTRPAAVAGTWYPASPGALDRDVDGYLAAAGRSRSARAARRDHRAARRADVLGPGRARMPTAAAGAGPFDASSSSGRRTSSPSTASRSIPPAPSSRRSGPAPIDEALGADAARRSPSSTRCRPRTRASTRSRCSCRSSAACCRTARSCRCSWATRPRDTIERLADALGARLAERQRRAARRQHRSVALLRRAHRRGARRARRRTCVAAFDPDRLLELFEQYPEGERGRYVACGGGADDRGDAGGAARAARGTAAC